LSPAKHKQWNMFLNGDSILNIRGFDRWGRRTLLKYYLRNHHIDVVCLQEMIKQDFTNQELRSLEVGGNFYLTWLPANSDSRGMLVGFHDNCFEVYNVDRGRYYISATVLCCAMNLKMEIRHIWADRSLTIKNLFRGNHG
jgi:mRNA deadenylase 3'-5' endonuclease subunit Ccr4